MFMKRLPGLVMIIILILMPVIPGSAGSGGLTSGPGKIIINVGLPEDPLLLPVFYYRPRRAGPDATVVFVIHGNRRDPDRYRDAWINHSDKHGFIVFAPEFSQKQFPGFWRFQMGNVFSATGKRKPAAQAAFAALERLFERIGAKYSLAAERYDLFGHSAGGQFVHRMVLFGPAKKLRRAVAANAGAYTLPDERVELPYGIKDAGLDRPAYASAFARDLRVMVGSKDTDPEHPALDRSSEALSQGPHRLARGQLFFKTSEEMANRMGFPFNWSFEIVPGVGHSAAGMSPAAAQSFKNRKALD